MEAIYTVHCSDHLVRTTVTATPSVVRNGCTALATASASTSGVGVWKWDWESSGSRASKPPPPSSSAWRTAVSFSQLHHADYCPDILRRFLVDPDVILVGLSNHRDAAMLMESRHGLKVQDLVELRHVAHDLRGCRPGASMGELRRGDFGDAWDG